MKSLDFKILTHEPNILKTILRLNKTRLQARHHPFATSDPGLALEEERGVYIHEYLI